MTNHILETHHRPHHCFRAILIKRGENPPQREGISDNIRPHTAKPTEVTSSLAAGVVLVRPIGLEFCELHTVNR